MQHAANSSQQYAPRLPGSLHTPTQSFSAAIQTPDSQGADWIDSKQSKDKELDSVRNRLLDPKFNIRDYADPLRPRQHPPSHYYPKGVTAEMEKNLLNLVARLETENV